MSLTLPQMMELWHSLADRGVPYRHCGRTLEGLDCIGVVVYPLVSTGVAFEDKSNYPRIATTGGSLFEALSPHMFHVEHSLPAALPGDVGLFWFDRRSRTPQHAGVLYKGDAGEWRLIHAYESAKRVIDSPLGPMWARRITHVLRFPDRVLRR
jgi:cell wall-associated NlpC family hydrolase